MTSTRWGGRKVKRLTAQVLALKGTVCHLCDLDGANSPDHDPARIELVRAGVPDPDALAFLFPAHLLCNLTRNDRPVTAALRAECRAKYLAATGRRAPTVDLSPRFGRRRPFFEHGDLARKPSLPVSPPTPQEKTR
jgi:hypothetical protein